MLEQQIMMLEGGNNFANDLLMENNNYNSNLNGGGYDNTDMDNAYGDEEMLLNDGGEEMQDLVGDDEY
jgi:hypothetical protein